MILGIKDKDSIGLLANKPKMAYSRDLPKMARWMTGMDDWYG